MEQTKPQLKAVIFDWAGTTVDYGCFAPVHAFADAFAQFGITPTMEEIREPMGMLKWDHIKTMLAMPRICSAWKEKYHREPQDTDVDEIYHIFEHQLMHSLEKFAQPKEDVPETIKALRQAGIAIGSTTGYTSEMMKQVAPAAEEYGYKPDCIVTPDVTGAGRPTPFMMYECMRRLNVYPPCAVVKAGDTITDIREGKNGGAWSIGILTGSNLLGLTKEEYETMGQEELAQRKEEAKKRYMEAGADLVIDSIRDLPQAIREINRRMQEEKKDECVL